MRIAEILTSVENVYEKNQKSNVPFPIEFAAGNKTPFLFSNLFRLPVRFLILMPAYMVAFSMLVCVKTMVDCTGAGAWCNSAAAERPNNRPNHAFVIFFPYGFGPRFSVFSRTNENDDESEKEKENRRGVEKKKKKKTRRNAIMTHRSS